MRLSIITINYNNCDGLRKTIKSVACQTFRDFEYVIIDGGSTDGSVKVIKDNEERINYWVSEKDKGIYHAMNKGVLAAHGEYTLFLNSGDVLCANNVLKTVFSNQLTADIVCGNIIYEHGGGLKAPIEVTMEFFINGSLPHPASFIKRVLFKQHPYDERFRISGDWEFFLHHLIERNVSYQKIDVNVTIFDTTGISSVTNSSECDPVLRREVLSRILLPRVASDYDLFMGKRDSYFKLFYIISKSKYKNAVYKFVVTILKVLMANRGWINNFH